MPASEPIEDDAEGDRFRLLIEAVTEYAIYMMDAEGFIISWNSGAQRLKGYSESDIIGQHYARFFTQADRDSNLPQRILAIARERGRHEVEGVRVRKDGTTFWASAVVHTVVGKAGQHIGFAKVTRDMSDRRAADLALAESERNFRLLVQSVVDYAIFMLDPSGLVTSWNAGAERIHGYSVEDIVGHHFSRLYSLEDRAAGLPARVLDTASRDGRYEAEGWRLKKDGTRIWAAVVIDAIHDENGVLLGFAKITRDITERRRAQEALLESERQFRLLMNSVTDYALFMLDLNGLVTSWNAGAERIKGYTAQEIIGQHFSKFYTDSERIAGGPARSLQTAMAQGRFESEGRRVRKDGTVFWANVVIEPVRDETGAVIGFAKITRDVTERRAAQHALQNAQAQLAQAQKMEALGQVTGGVAHDFNNLLMVISGYGSTLRQRLADDEKGLRAVTAIELAAKRGEALTRQLLSFSRRMTLRPMVLHMRETLEAMRPLLAGTLGSKLKLVETVAADVWPVQLDPNEFELVLINLLANARDAMSQDGLVTLTVENVTLARGAVPDDIAGEFVAISIADTGSGILPDVLPKVFDPFFTTKGVGKGTGLGLSQVHGFAYQSGGAVTIRSEVGKGTCVTVYLPRAAADAAVAAETVAGEPFMARSILLVEDHPDVAEASRALIESLGCEVQVAANADAALEALEQRAFDLMLSDIVMAGSMNGLQLGRVVRQKYPNLPVLLATGYSTAGQDAMAEFTVLRKPYDYNALRKAMLAVRGPRPLIQGGGNVVRLRDAKRERAVR